MKKQVSSSVQLIHSSIWLVITSIMLKSYQTLEDELLADKAYIATCPQLIHGEIIFILHKEYENFAESHGDL